MKYVGIKPIWRKGEEKPVEYELHENGDGMYFTQGGIGEQKEFVIFNLAKRRFEFEE